MNKKRKIFSLLYDKHYKRLFNYTFKVLGNKEAVEELVQETFIKVWENFENINQDERSMSSYLVTVLKNKIVDDHRKNKVREKHLDLYKLNTEFISEMDNQWELEKQIDSIYNSLNPKTAEIFRLSRDQGLTYPEIADLKGISVKTVESHISKALIIFREKLKKF